MEAAELEQIGKQVASVVDGLRKDVFEPMREDLQDIKHTQIQHGERLVKLDTAILTKGNCAKNTAQIESNVGKIDDIEAETVSNRASVFRLALLMLAGTLGIIGTFLVAR